MANTEMKPLLEKAQLKALLKLSRRRPVSCVIAMTKTHEGVLLLDKLMKPRKLLAELRRQASTEHLPLDISSIRFGRTTIGGSSDRPEVRFTVNKPAPGAMRRALLPQLRPVGFQHCEITVDEALESESDEEMSQVNEEDDEAEQDVAYLRSDLLGLAKELGEVVQHDPARKAALLDLASSAQAELKAGKLDDAAVHIDELRTALHSQRAGKAQDSL